MKAMNTNSATGLTKKCKNILSIPAIPWDEINENIGSC